MFLYQISKFHFQIIISKLFLSLITFEFFFHINFSSNFHRKGNFFISINSSYEHNYLFEHNIIFSNISKLHQTSKFQSFIFLSFFSKYYTSSYQISKLFLNSSNFLSISIRKKIPILT